MTPREMCRIPSIPAPADRPHYVYRYYDSRGLLLYVGCTRDPIERDRAHRRKSWYRSVASVRRTIFPNRTHALAVEKRAIQAERPAYNVQHGPSRMAA